MRIRYILGLVVVLFGITACSFFENKNKTDWELHLLKGKVAVCVDSVFNAKEVDGQLAQGDLLEFKKKVFSKEGYVTEKFFFKADSTLIIHFEVNRDKLDFVKELAGYNNAQRLILRIIPRYDEEGNVVEEKIFDMNGSLMETVQCEFERGFLSRAKIWDNKGVHVRTSEYENDKTGLPIIYREYSHITKSDDCCLATDRDPLDVKVINLDDKLSLDFSQEFKYEYDGYGNWLKRECYIDGKLVRVIVRSLTYFSN